MSPCRDELPTLPGEVFDLRPALEGEVRAVVEQITKDPVAGDWWGLDPDTIMRWFADDDVCVLLVDDHSGPIGLITYTEVHDWDYHSAGIDIGLLSGTTGRGIGTAALRRLAVYLFDVRGHHRLTIDPAFANEHAVRAYEKVGFKRIGVAREYERGNDGEYHDGLLMDMLREDLTEGAA